PPDAAASVFSSSWASFPIQTNTCRRTQEVKDTHNKRRGLYSWTARDSPDPRDGVTSRSPASFSDPLASAELLPLPFHVQDPEEDIRRKTSLEFRLEAEHST
ncbi:hypothetical protein LDENG_00226010, partial [Lucifuga dentata]